MGGAVPEEGDVERQQPGSTGEEADPKNAVAQDVQEITAGEKYRQEGAFKRFLGGPFFDIIPSQEDRVAHKVGAHKHDAHKQGSEAAQPCGDDYLNRLRHIVLNPVDVDGVYGLQHEELVPLPFDVPKWHAYLVEILAGVYSVAQATIVMFIAVYVENQERSWKDGGNYTKSWLPLVKALIIIYPLVTLIILVSFTVDCCVKKFMYFRLLSMRILVDWENKPAYKTVFFYYFVATWIMMNAWAIYGVAKYYNKGGNTGVDPVSFGTFVIVNLQTIHLLLYYFKLLSTESRLVSLNQIFERAPVEAQHLLEFTYVIEEQDLIDECYNFALSTQRTFIRRLLNIATCCLAAKDWNEADKQIRFDIERLKRRAPNCDAVDENVRELMEDARRAQGGASKSTDKGNGGSSEVGLDDVTPEVTDAAKDGGHARHTSAPREFAPESLSCCGWRPLRWVYQNSYASLHSLHVSVMVGFPSWSFRPDTPYFRLLTFVQLGGIFAVGAIVVLGWLFSTRESTCTKSTKTCNTCLSVHERYFTSQEPLCGAMETVIANIVASANGTWNVNGVVEERYCNWACYGNFTPSSQSCPVALT